MNKVSNDMMGALRLTRQGRLKEAVAMLRGRQARVAPRMGAENPALGRLGLARAMRVPVPEQRAAGSTFEERSFANDAGSLKYKLFVPSGYTGKALPLVVMLHGCTQSPDDFAAGTGMNSLAEARGFLVAYPAQARTANLGKCWNWFNVANQTRDQGETSIIAGITSQIMDDFAVQPGRIYVAGLSAGGATAAIMGTLYPELYAAVGVHSGLACGAASDMTSALTAMRQGGVLPSAESDESRRVIPTIVFHGDKDTTVNAVNGDQVIAQAKGAAELRTTVIEGEAASGMGYTRTIQSDDSGRPILEEWMLHGAGHAWSGGNTAGSYTDPRGPNASAEMIRFFFQQSA
jgi:poly(hydroxyalkanoate) depolymerase family esterase